MADDVETLIDGSLEQVVGVLDALKSDGVVSGYRIDRPVRHEYEDDDEDYFYERCSGVVFSPEGGAVYIQFDTDDEYVVIEDFLARDDMGVDGRYMVFSVEDFRSTIESCFRLWYQDGDSDARYSAVFEHLDFPPLELGTSDGVVRFSFAGEGGNVEDLLSAVDKLTWDGLNPSVSVVKYYELAKAFVNAFESCNPSKGDSDV